MAVKEQREMYCGPHLNDLDLGIWQKQRCGGDVHVHESRQEPDMSGCGPLKSEKV